MLRGLCALPRALSPAHANQQSQSVAPQAGLLNLATGNRPQEQTLSLPDADASLSAFYFGHIATDFFRLERARIICVVIVPDGKRRTNLSGEDLMTNKGHPQGSV